MHDRTCSEMDIWSSGPRMATLPAMVAGSVSKMTLHEHVLSQQHAMFHQAWTPPSREVMCVYSTEQSVICWLIHPWQGGVRCAFLDSHKTGSAS